MEDLTLKLKLNDGKVTITENLAKLILQMAEIEGKAEIEVIA